MVLAHMKALILAKALVRALMKALILAKSLASVEAFILVYLYFIRGKVYIFSNRLYGHRKVYLLV